MLTAIAESGYKFDHWSGDLSGSENPAIVTMVSGKEVGANFTRPLPWWWIVAGVLGGAGGVLTVIAVRFRSLLGSRKGSRFKGTD